MTQEEVNNLKIGDCFLWGTNIVCKIIKEVSYPYVYSLAISIVKNTIYRQPKFRLSIEEVMKEGKLIDSEIFNQITQTLDRAVDISREIIASSSAIAEKED